MSKAAKFTLGQKGTAKAYKTARAILRRFGASTLLRHLRIR